MADSSSETPKRGKLSIVATPIGNLGDITLRALEALREADHIVAEDTRRTKALLTHFEIRSKRLTALHQHSDTDVVNQLVNEALSDKNLALVSDAGTPTVSDPGRELIQAAVAAGVVVDVLPGASAVTVAVTFAALAGHGYRFVGFLPRRGKERKAQLEQIVNDALPTVLFESPQRIRATLEEIATVGGAERQVVVCRELTKLHQEILRGSVPTVLAGLAASPRGEITVVVAGRDEVSKLSSTGDEAAARNEAIDAALAAARAARMSDRDIARDLSTRFSISRRDAYQRVLNSKR